MLEAGLNGLERLERKGLVRWQEGVPRATRRWQGAMARAAVELLDAGATSGDLRLPIARALLDFFDVNEPVEALADLVEAMLPIQQADLGYWPESEPA